MTSEQLNKSVNAIVCMVLAAAALAFSVGMFLSAQAESAKPSAPTYHCDGSDTMGYATPGTPEARACWIEESK